jgi:hypothetical protein
VLTGRPSIHWYNCELIRVPITSGICCPLGFVNRSWERLPGDLQSLQAGAGNQEHSPAKIRRTNVASAELKSGDVAASAGKTESDLAFPRRQSRRLLHDKPFCSGHEPNVKHVGPEALTRSIAVDGGCHACILAGRPSDNDIDKIDPESKVSNVVMNIYPRESLFDQRAARWLNLAKRNRFDSGPSESNRVTTEAGEQVERLHFVTPIFCPHAGIHSICTVFSGIRHFRKARPSGWMMVMRTTPHVLQIHSRCSKVEIE